MKLSTFKKGDDVFVGVVNGNEVRRIEGCFDDGRTDIKTMLSEADLNAIAEHAEKRSSDHNIADLEFLPVIPKPDKIICVGLNYEEHRAETGRPSTAHPTLFTRFANSQTGHLQPIIQPRESQKLDYEAELAVIIGTRGKHIPLGKAMDYIAGYSCYNDGSVRDWQSHTSQWTPGKNFTATGAFGPWLVTRFQMGELTSQRISTRLNGETLQDAMLDQLIFTVPELIEYISRFTELVPGDVIVSGTPGGVGFKRDPQIFMRPGDEVVVEIEGIGELRNPIIAAG